MDWAAVISALEDVPLEYFFYAILLNSVIAFFGALSYKILFYIQNEELDIVKSFFILHIAQFVNFLTPFKTGAIFGKPLITRLIGGMPLTKSIFAVGFENFFSIAWQLLMLPILLLLVGENVMSNNMILKIATIMVFFVVFGIMSYKYKWVLTKLMGLRRYLPSRIKKMALKAGLNEEIMKEFIENIPSYFSNKRLLLMLVFLTIIQVLLSPLFLAIAALFFDIKLSYLNLFAVYWISYILGRLSFLPSGLGVKDVTMGGLLFGLGIDKLIAIKTVVLFRVLTFVPHLIIGGSVFLYYGHKYTYRKFFKKELATDENEQNK